MNDLTMTSHFHPTTEAGALNTCGFNRSSPLDELGTNNVLSPPQRKTPLELAILRHCFQAFALQAIADN
jgi:hypothetical protein